MKTSVLIIVALLTFSYVNAQKTDSKEPEQTEKQGVILFKKLVYDFGTIEYGSEAVAVFVFKNMTKQPVKLTNVKTSCGCTGAEWPREEIAKKKKNKITVTYDSKRVGKFQKTIYVYVEGQENPIQLEIKGEVSQQSGDQQKTDNKSSENIKGANSQTGAQSSDFKKSAKPDDAKSISTSPGSMTKPARKSISDSDLKKETDVKSKTN
jgi:hypothetical protein